MIKEARGRGKINLCAFCRVPSPTSEAEENQRIQKLTEADNAYAFYQLAACYESGMMGMPQDFEKANKLYLRGGELGCARAYCNLGLAYYSGRGGEVDVKKAKHYYELAAIDGNIQARHNLGCMEADAGNVLLKWL